jgi:hypothetical protein
MLDCTFLPLCRDLPLLSNELFGLLLLQPIISSQVTTPQSRTAHLHLIFLTLVPFLQQIEQFLLHSPVCFLVDFFFFLLN